MNSNVEQMAYDDHKFDRRLRIVFALVVLIMVVLLAFAAVAVPSILTSANNTDSVRRGNDLSACRAIANSRVVDATSTVQADRTTLELLTNEGLSASVTHDQAALLTTVQQSSAVRRKLAEDTQTLHDASDAYVQAIRDSQQDPDAFLQRCRG